MNQRFYFIQIADVYFCTIQLAILLMERTRRSLRGVTSCNQIHNIFHRREGEPTITEKLPSKLMKQVGNTRTISCGDISQLLPFRLGQNQEEEFQGMKIATRYQLDWQVSFTGFKGREQMGHGEIGINQVQVNLQNNAKMQVGGQFKSMKRYDDIWQDSVFLQKINDFIMGEQTNRKAIVSTGTMLHN